MNFDAATAGLCQRARTLPALDEACIMICRSWRGWTNAESARTYEEIVRQQVIPAIEARRIPGFLHIDLMKRDLGNEVEFQTLMWFENLTSVEDFVGEDYSVSHVPEAARKVLVRFEHRASHYEVLDRREQ